MPPGYQHPNFVMQGQGYHGGIPAWLQAQAAPPQGIPQPPNDWEYDNDEEEEEDDEDSSSILYCIMLTLLH